MPTLDRNLIRVMAGNDTIGWRDISAEVSDLQFTDVRPGGAGSASFTIYQDSLGVGYNELRPDREIVISYAGQRPLRYFILPRGITTAGDAAPGRVAVQVDCAGYLERLKHRTDYGRIWCDPDTSAWEEATDDDTGTNITLDRTNNVLKFLLPAGSDPSTEFLKNLDYELHKGLVTDQTIAHVKGTWYGSGNIRWKLQSKATAGASWSDEFAYQSCVGKESGTAWDETVASGAKFLRLVVVRNDAAKQGVACTEQTWNYSRITITTTSSGQPFVAGDKIVADAEVGNSYPAGTVLTVYSATTNTITLTQTASGQVIGATDFTVSEYNAATADEYVRFEPITVYTTSGTLTLNTALDEILTGTGLASDYIGDTALDSAFTGALAARPFTTRAAAAETIARSAPSGIVDWWYEDDIAYSEVRPTTAASIPRQRWYVAGPSSPGVTVEYESDSEDTPDYVYVIYGAYGISGTADGTKLGVYRPSTPTSPIDRVATVVTGRFMNTTEATAHADQLLARYSSDVLKAKVNAIGSIRDVDGHVIPAALIRAGDWVQLQGVAADPIYITGISYADGICTITTGGREQTELIVPGIAALPEKVKPQVVRPTPVAPSVTYTEYTGDDGSGGGETPQLGIGPMDPFTEVNPPYIRPTPTPPTPEPPNPYIGPVT